MNPSQQLLKEIEQACAKLGMSPSYLCKQAVGNGHLPRRLEEGSSPSIKTANTIRTFIKERLEAVNV